MNRKHLVLSPLAATCTWHARAERDWARHKVLFVWCVQDWHPPGEKFIMPCQTRSTSIPAMIGTTSAAWAMFSCTAG